VERRYPCTAAVYVVAVGTWGVGVFDSDDALDIRADFRELVGAGYPSEDATGRLVELGRIDDRAESRSGWIALAVTQWKTGRLLDWVRSRALEVIDAAPGEEWVHPKDVRRRRTVLERTRAQSVSPQRAPVRIRWERYAQSPFMPGDLLRFTCASGREVALWAITNKCHEGLTYVSINTVFQLIAFGTPAVASPSVFIASDPVEFIPGGGSKQLAFVMPQDAVGPHWEVIGNYPFPVERRVSGRTAFAPSKADAVFEAWCEHLLAAGRSDAGRT